jgi:ribonuclease BN (tRNA processing enzyme)
VKVTILGCSGGIGGGRHTTSLLVDDDILIDAGSGVTKLSVQQLAAIDHVFITHTHLDHILALPLMLDSVGAMRDRPVTVYAIDSVIEILRQDIFNWRIWPDFTEVPAERPYLRYEAVDVYEATHLGKRSITPLPASHTVPAVGYQLDSGVASLVFSGDTGPNPALWDWVNRIENLRTVIIETAFPQDEHGIAVDSKHLSPELLAIELAQLKRPADIYITHLKPGREQVIMEEIARYYTAHQQPRMLEEGTIFSV